MGGRNANPFGQVQTRAAAHANQSVATFFFEQRHGRAHRRLGWVGRRLIKDRTGMIAQGRQGPVEYPGGANARVGDDERLAHPRTLALFAKLGDHTKVKVDLGDVLDECHGSVRGGIK